MEDRKKDHIELAFTSRIPSEMLDSRFNYEPMLSAHPLGEDKPFPFLGRLMRVPMWVSSMTGGTELARTINTNLARACNEFGMGMGLGSCRILLENDKYLPDFDMRGIIGDELPFYANIGIGQLEQMLEDSTSHRLEGLVEKLRADGLIIHVNPIQEWLQKEGDLIRRPPLDTITEFLESTDMKVIIKEVGQGMGPESIRLLMKLNIEAFEFAAYGGTNFARLEMARGEAGGSSPYEPLAFVGHNAGQMLEEINKLVTSGETVRCRHLIISGGIRSFLDGYYLLCRSSLPAVFGQASGFLKHARGDYETLRAFVSEQARGIQFARAFLRLKEKP